MIEGGVYVVLITAPRGKGRELARSLVERGLAACVNVVEARSVYRWRGRIEEDDEDLLVAKTPASKLEELAKALRELHPYEVPELVALPVAGCLASYCRWVRGESEA